MLQSIRNVGSNLYGRTGVCFGPWPCTTDVKHLHFAAVSTMPLNTTPSAGIGCPFWVYFGIRGITRLYRCSLSLLHQMSEGLALLQNASYGTHGLATLLEVVSVQWHSMPVNSSLKRISRYLLCGVVDVGEVKVIL